MSGIIGFLERVGRDSRLRHASAEELAQALNEAGVEEAASRTVLGGGWALLQGTLHVDRTLCCLVYAPDEEEEREDEEEEEDAGGDDDESEKNPLEVPRQ